MLHGNGYAILAFALLALAGCGNNSGKPMVKSAAANAALCKDPQKITAIYKEYVYDLSGYGGMTGPSAFALFDENSISDPRSTTDIKPITNPHPQYGAPTFFRDHGSRIVVDLRVPYKISDIYLYDRSRYSDTVWVYTGNMKEWKLKAHFATVGDPAMWGWRKIEVGDSTQLVMFRFRSPEAEISEAVMYGCPYRTPPPPPPTKYTGPRLPPKMLKEFLGVNCFQGTPMRFMKPFYYSRVYTDMGHIDYDTNARYPNVKYNIVPHGWWNNGTNDYNMYVDSVRMMGYQVWYSILGIPNWLRAKNYPNDNRPVTKLGQNMEDPMSYARHANMFWNLAAAYGFTAVDTNLIQAANEHRFSGRHTFHVYENGNESDGFNGMKYCNPVEYFALSSADYDGNEGKMGPRHGIKNADPHAELMMAGLSRLDVNRVRVLKFLCNSLRSDSQFLWKGGIQYHWYSQNGKGSPVKIFETATAGISPEEDSLRKKLARVREETYLIQPGVEACLGEYGYDKSRQSKVSVPLVPGYSQTQSHGIMMVRAVNAIFFSGFDSYIIYWIKDNSDENDPRTYLTCGLIREFDAYTHKAYPAWFYISTMVNHLGNYVPDKIISESGDVWIYKYRNKISPDSAAYFVYCPTHSGKKVDQYQLNIGKAQSATEISFKDESTEGTTRNLPINGNRVTVNVSEMPKMIVVKE